MIIIYLREKRMGIGVINPLFSSEGSRLYVLSYFCVIKILKKGKILQEKNTGETCVLTFFIAKKSKNNKENKNKIIETQF